VPEDYTDGVPDISLKFCSGGVDRIPEVDLVGQLGEGGQERLDGGVWTGRSKVLKFTVDHCFRVPINVETHGNSEGDDTREDIRAGTSGLPADRATPIVPGTVRWVSVSTETIPVGGGEMNVPNTNGFSGHLGVIEDTRQVINQITHRGGTLDITGVT